MKTSDYYKLFAIANRRTGNERYASMLENQAAVEEAREIIKESHERKPKE